MKTKTKVTTYKILKLLYLGALISAVFIAPGIGKAFRGSRKWRRFNQGRLKDNLRRLRKQRMIGLKKVGDNTHIVITEKGRERLLQYDLDRMKIKIPKEWDGYWRIVVFDIPEDYKTGRDALRSKLKRLGFYQFQKSVFIHPFECKDEIEYLKEIYEISPFVKYIVAETIDNEFILKQHFKL